MQTVRIRRAAAYLSRAKVDSTIPTRARILPPCIAANLLCYCIQFVCKRTTHKGRPRLTILHGRAMAQAVIRRPLTAEARFRSRVSPCGICGGQSGIGTGFSLSTSVFRCQFHSTDAPLLGKIKNKLIIFLFIITRVAQ
jgi:hypothetical protein